MITQFKIYEIKTETYDDMSNLHREYSENLDDVVQFIKEDKLIIDDWKNAVIDAITNLPNKYIEKVYADRMIFHVDYKEEGSANIIKGDKILGHVGISDVGIYWEHTDLPVLKEHFDKYNLDLNYVHEYHYITIKSGKGLDKYYHTAMKKYNI